MANPTATPGPSGILGLTTSSAVPPKPDATTATPFDPATDPTTAAIYRAIMGQATSDPGQYDLGAIINSGQVPRNPLDIQGALMHGITRDQTIMAPGPAGAPAPLVAPPAVSLAPMVPMAGDVNAATRATDPAPAAAPSVGPNGLPNIPLPVMQPLPAAPAPLPVATPPQYDIAGAMRGGQDAVKGVGNLFSIANIIALLSGGPGAAQGVNMMGPGAIEAALAGNTAGAQERFGAQQRNAELQLAAQREQDARRQTQYAQSVAGVEQSNKNAQQLFEDPAQLRGQDVSSQWHTGTVNNAAVRNTNSTRAQFLSLDPASQQAMLQANPGMASQLGFAQLPDGSFSTVTTNKDDNAGVRAGAAVTNAKAHQTSADAAVTNGNTRSWEAHQLAKHWGMDEGLAQQRITEYAHHNGVTEEQAATRIGQGFQALKIRQENIRQEEVNIAYDRFNKATATTDPGQQQMKLDKARQYSAGKRAQLMSAQAKLKPSEIARQTDEEKAANTNAITAYTTAIQHIDAQSAALQRRLQAPQAAAAVNAPARVPVQTNNPYQNWLARVPKRVPVSGR